MGTVVWQLWYYRGTLVICWFWTEEKDFWPFVSIQIVLKICELNLWNEYECSYSVSVKCSISKTVMQCDWYVEY